ncbi:LOW QUALITY PROTEIN: apelin [Ammospiza caudacuta]|uniref:LOW QUALITY PROTEIN: apelin n=1 Tax=Ammospiza caudacuta TaxID=2857398 RepID=UPI0027389FCC|nr:LOW QUALITY PROTEIN: apelin [Ammospiza caudacuta]
MALVGDNAENRPAQGQAAPGTAVPVLRADTWLTLFLISSGPLAKAPDGKDAQGGLARRLVRPRGARRGPGQRPGGWRRTRRPRPRLSHKGPMPF